MKKIIYSALILLLPLISVAQQDPMVSQYMFSGLFLNPGYAGSHQYSNVTLLFRKQWVNFEGAPVTQFASFDAPLRNINSGVGFLVSNDHIGVTRSTNFYGNYSYHIPLGGNNYLSTGVKAGLSYYRAKLTDLTIWEAGDKVFENDIKGVVMPNFGLGLYYYSEKFYAGLSAPHLLSYEPGNFLNVKMEDAHKIIRHYYANAGYAWVISEAVAIKPSVLVKYVPSAPVQADLNLHFLFAEVVWVGGSYRTGDSFVGMLEVQAMKNLRLGYAYDRPVTVMRHYSSGSHEIMLAYDFGKEVIKLKTPRYF